MSAQFKFTVLFKNLDTQDNHLVTQKLINLGHLQNIGINIADGFIVTPHAFLHFLKENNLTTKIKHLLNVCDFTNQESITHTSLGINKLLKNAAFSNNLANEIYTDYKKINASKDSQLLVAYTEYADNHNFESTPFTGEAVLIEEIKTIWSTIFTPKFLINANKNSLSEIFLKCSIVIQKYYPPEKSGTVFTHDPITQDSSKFIIKAYLGQVNSFIKSEYMPDIYEVSKNFSDIIRKNINIQKKYIKFNKSAFSSLPVLKDFDKQKLTDKQIIKLSSICNEIQNKLYFPQKINWIMYGNQFYIISVNDISIIPALKSTNNKLKSDVFVNRLLASGDMLNPGIAIGILNRDILAINKTDYGLIKKHKYLKAILLDSTITDKKFINEIKKLDIPTIYNINELIYKVKYEKLITINAEMGKIYSGGLSEKIIADSKPETTIKIIKLIDENINKEDLNNADGIAILNHDLIFSHLKNHPKEILKNENENEYIEKFAAKIADICNNSGEKYVIYKLSDFDSLKYKNLTNGNLYEPWEYNPLLGYRGALRHIQDSKSFELELKAVKMAKLKLNNKNLILALPLIRSKNEFIEIKKMLDNAGLIGNSKFKIYFTVCTPANVYNLEQITGYDIDGIMVDTAHLETLLLGADVNNFEVSNAFHGIDNSLYFTFDKIFEISKNKNLKIIIQLNSHTRFKELIKMFVNNNVDMIITNESVQEIRKVICFEEKHYLHYGKN